MAGKDEGQNPNAETQPAQPQAPNVQVNVDAKPAEQAQPAPQEQPKQG